MVNIQREPVYRPLDSAEAAAATSLIAQCFHPDTGDEFLRDWSALFAAERTGRPWGACVGPDIVAYLAWVDVDPVGQDLFTLQWGCVHPQWRHRRLLHGLAREILHDMESHLDHNGLIMVKTWPVKPVLALGFRPVDGYRSSSGKALLTRPLTVDESEYERKPRDHSP